MFPDFPDLKKSVDEHLMKTLSERARRMTGVMERVKRTIHHEGNTWTLTRLDGEPETSAYSHLGSEIKLDLSAVPHMTQAEVAKLLDGLVIDIAQQHSELFFSTIGQGVEKVGNVVDAGGAPLSPEMYLELYEKIDLGFDNDGQPRLPTLVASPKLCEKWAAEIKKWYEDPSFRTRMNDIIERKRASWNAREACRRLVD